MVNATRSERLTDESDIDALQQWLDAVPPPLDPLDVCAVDGYLCGVLLQPSPPPLERWWPFVADIEGRALAPGEDASVAQRIVLRRQAELEAAIARRRWFDPWIFEGDTELSPSLAVAPWVAGFALAVERFPGLMRLDAPSLLEPLALLYRHLDADDLEDADDLLAEIEQLEPAEDLPEAVEDLVRATLLLADVSRPIAPLSRRPSRRNSQPRRRPR